MRRRLRRLGYPPELGEQAVARLVALGYLDDAAFARAWVESRDRVRPRGALALRRELAVLGLAPELISEVLAEREAPEPRAEVAGTPPPTDADTRAATALLERRRRSLGREPDVRRRRQRAYALLARAGFDPETCRAAVAAFVSPDVGDVETHAEEG